MLIDIVRQQHNGIVRAKVVMTSTIMHLRLEIPRDMPTRT